MALAVWIVVAWVVLGYGLTWVLRLAVVAVHLAVWLALAIGALGCLIYLLVFDRAGLKRQLDKDRANAQVRAVLIRERWS